MRTPAGETPPLSTDAQLLDAFVAGCNAENELGEHEMSPGNIRKGIASAMRGVLRGVCAALLCLVLVLGWSVLHD